MAENPGKSFPTAEECRRCGLQPAVFLHYVWHKGQYLHICTACVLNLHQGSFCPICFAVYDHQNNPSNDRVKCSACEATYHLACVPSLSSFFSSLPTTSFSSSSSIFPQSYCVVCPFCSSPNLKFFNFIRDEGTNAVKINRYLASQLLAAATISNRSMKKAAKMASVRAQIMCKEAVEARKKAQEALEKLHGLTFAPLEEDSESEYASDDDDNDDDDDASDAKRM